jgi:hypothetical protein
MQLTYVEIPRPRRSKFSDENLASLPVARLVTIAEGIVNSARISGRLKVKPCCVCGGSGDHAHHEDYRQPYRVAFLCTSGA